MPSVASRLTRRRFLVGGLASGVGLGVHAWKIEPHWLETVHRDLPLEDLPKALEGKRLIQISDWHAGYRVETDYLRECLRQVRELEPDILVATGDFISYRDEADLRDLQRVVEGGPRGGLATLAIPGNHDYGVRWRQAEVARRVAEILGGAGYRWLSGGIAEAGGLRIAGAEDLWGPRFDAWHFGSLLRLGRPHVVLAHNPDTADRPCWEGFRGWILSGHTHGGQCKPPFLPPPLLPVRNRRYVAGEVELSGGRRLYINRGLGHTIPVRFNVRPEITCFRLVAA